jgi:phenylalanyl-tRNA synthetase beta chain
MDLLIPNSWLKKFLDTKATPVEIAKYLSLCGPSIEKIETTKDGDHIYNIEVTTNRVDTASVQGIAREASAILPRFGIKANIKNNTKATKNKYKFANKVKYLNVLVDEKLCPRFTAVLIKEVKIKESPQSVKSLLEKVGVRPINNIVDVSNFIMHELGQPVHTFDYDKIAENTMKMRESKKGESIMTLDDKEFVLEGGDIVIEDGSDKLIDLCGIMGGKNSAIDSSTKNVLLFVQNYNQHKIRKTSMYLGQRTEAAVLFEKGLDSENVKPAILEAIYLIEELSGGKAEREILDIYPSPYKPKKVSVLKNEIDTIIGIEINKDDISNYLTNLGFEIKWINDKLEVIVPSYRADDINIKEDIAEEIARIYGYHNLPSQLMSGQLPQPRINPEFEIEKKIKSVLQSLGATEIYNISLVTKEMAGEHSLHLKNPLGSDTEYLRTSLIPSLIEDINNNPQKKDILNIFELSNVYEPTKDNLPKEKLTLAGVIKNSEYRSNKGIVETLLDELDIEYTTKIEDAKNYLPNQRIEVWSNKRKIGEYGNLENELSSSTKDIFYYEFTIEALIDSKKKVRKYQDVSKYPPQIEDLTLVIPEKTYIGEVIDKIKSVSEFVEKVELVGIYENSFTFNVAYQASNHTLTNKEVEEIRNKILSLLKSRFGINLKS